MGERVSNGRPITVDKEPSIFLAKTIEKESRMA